MSYILGTLVYVLRDDEVLVMHRNKEPNLGLWIAPGGKVELGESPYETAQREMLEETGLTVENLHLAGLCTEISPFADWLWMLFIFVTTQFAGELVPDLREGRLAWLSMAEYLNNVPIPQADVVFAPRILRNPTGLFQAKFVYDDDLKLVEWTQH